MTRKLAGTLSQSWIWHEAERGYGSFTLRFRGNKRRKSMFVSYRVSSPSESKTQTV